MLKSENEKAMMLSLSHVGEPFVVRRMPRLLFLAQVAGQTINKFHSRIYGSYGRVMSYS